MRRLLLRRAKWRGKGKKKKSKKKEGEDLYALLGLQNERWTATAEQIKSAYRRAALIHHPDKQARPCACSLVYVCVRGEGCP